MNYEDFGPQALSWEHIGKEWWQWQSHGDSNPNTKYDVKVVVYRDISLEEIKKIILLVKRKIEIIAILNTQKH